MPRPRPHDAPPSPAHSGLGGVAEGGLGPAGTSPAQRGSAGAVALLVVGLLGIVALGALWMRHQAATRVADLRLQLHQARAERTAQAALQDRIHAFEARQAELEERIAILTELRGGRMPPAASVLARVERHLPPGARWEVFALEHGRFDLMVRGTDPAGARALLGALTQGGLWQEATLQDAGAGTEAFVLRGRLAPRPKAGLELGPEQGPEPETGPTAAPPAPEASDAR